MVEIPWNVTLFTIVSYIFLDSCNRLVLLHWFGGKGEREREKENDYYGHSMACACAWAPNTHRSSAKTWSNSEVETKNKIDVTERSKHFVHFCRCVRWPPTSTKTKGISWNQSKNWVSDRWDEMNGLWLTYFDFYCKFVNTFCRLPTVQNILVRWNIIRSWYSIDLIEEVINWITLRIIDKRETINFNWLRGSRGSATYNLKFSPSIVGGAYGLILPQDL